MRARRSSETSNAARGAGSRYTTARRLGVDTCPNACPGRPRWGAAPGPAAAVSIPTSANRTVGGRPRRRRRHEQTEERRLRPPWKTLRTNRTPVPTETSATGRGCCRGDSTGPCARDDVAPDEEAASLIAQHRASHVVGRPPNAAGNLREPGDLRAPTVSAARTDTVLDVPQGGADPLLRASPAKGTFQRLQIISPRHPISDHRLCVGAIRCCCRSPRPFETGNLDTQPPAPRIRPPGGPPRVAAPPARDLLRVVVVGNAGIRQRPGRHGNGGVNRVVGPVCLHPGIPPVPEISGTPGPGSRVPTGKLDRHPRPRMKSRSSALAGTESARSEVRH